MKRQEKKERIEGTLAEATLESIDKEKGVVKKTRPK